MTPIPCPSRGSDRRALPLPGPRSPRCPAAHSLQRQDLRSRRSRASRSRRSRASRSRRRPSPKTARRGKRRPHPPRSRRLQPRSAPGRRSPVGAAECAGKRAGKRLRRRGPRGPGELRRGEEKKFGTRQGTWSRDSAPRNGFDPRETQHPGAVAHMGERLTGSQKVESSILFGSTPATAQLLTLRRLHFEVRRAARSRLRA